MLITFNFLTERFDIFTICRRPPVLQTDARVGMMKMVVRETEARKVRAADFHTPITRYRTLLRAGAQAIPAPLWALSACKI